MVLEKVIYVISRKNLGGFEMLVLAEKPSSVGKLDLLAMESVWFYRDLDRGVVTLGNTNNFFTELQ
jgi:hypothetical protein